MNSDGYRLKLSPRWTRSLKAFLKAHFRKNRMPQKGSIGRLNALLPPSVVIRPWVVMGNSSLGRTSRLFKVGIFARSDFRWMPWMVRPERFV